MRHERRDGTAQERASRTRDVLWCGAERRYARYTHENLKSALMNKTHSAPCGPDSGGLIAAAFPASCASRKLPADVRLSANVRHVGRPRRMDHRAGLTLLDADALSDDIDWARPLLLVMVLTTARVC